MRIRLQVSVALAFAVLMVIVLGVTVAFFYVSNRDLAIGTARNAMAAAQTRSDAALVTVVEPAIRLVAQTEHFARTFRDEIGTPRGLDMIAASFEGVEHVDSVYFADAATGALLLVARVPAGMTTFGASHIPVPKGAVRLHRRIGTEGGVQIERIAFLAASGAVLAESVEATDFDVRKRPWFVAALARDAPVISPIYVFAGSGRPGITFSRRVAGPDGAATGVVGVDMSLDTVTDILTDVRVDGLGEVFLLAQTGQLIATSEAAPGALAPLTAAALAQWDRTDNAFFRVALPGGESVQLVSMARLTPILGTRPLLGVIVPRDHFVGSIVTTTRRVIGLAALVGLGALAATALLSRLLSTSLRQVTQEAGRISAFDLDKPFTMRSRITEVAELGTAMVNMKNSLTSFGAYVPKDVVRSLVASGGTVAVGGAARDVTLLFSDIEGFTRKSEALAPETVMRDLSRYFEAMTRAVTSQGGTVDKFIGDAVMAIWNAPDAVADHAAMACRGALTCLAAEAELNRAAEGALCPTRTRIGLHTDRVVAGNMGSTERLQYTAIGGAVNLASRVEGLNKHYGTQVLATQAVVDAVGNRFVFREVDLVSPAGTSRPVGLHELLGQAGTVADPVLQAVADWHAALARFRQGDWDGARAAFATLRGGVTGDHLVNLYLARCAAFAAAPPGPDWTGVTVLNEK